MTLYALDGVAPTLPDTPIWIAPNAHIVGDAVLEAEVSVWFGVTMRGDTERLKNDLFDAEQGTGALDEDEKGEDGLHYFKTASVA